MEDEHTSGGSSSSSVPAAVAGSGSCGLRGGSSVPAAVAAGGPAAPEETAESTAARFARMQSRVMSADARRALGAVPVGKGPAPAPGGGASHAARKH